MYEKTKKGPNPLPLYEEKTKELKQRINRIGLSRLEISKFAKISYPNFCAKLRGYVGWNEIELKRVEKILQKKETEIISQIG